jgi:Fic family protein
MLVRLEVTYQNNNPKYYLVKDVRVGRKNGKVKKYLGTTPPSSEELEAYKKKYAAEIELKAAKATGRLAALAYKTQYLSKEQVSLLEELRYLARASSKLITKSESEAYEQQFEVKYVQGTTAIEGNTLSLREASDLLLHGIIPNKKSLREINEVQNFRSVKSYRESYNGYVNPEFIKRLHSLIVHNIDEESAGVFRRTDDIGIAGTDIQLSPSIMIEDDLRDISTYYYKRIKDGYHPFEEAVMYHYFFETIHPFADGNGRVGREILNYMLAWQEYPRLLFLGKDRAAYIDALRHGNAEEYQNMVTAFVDLVIGQRMNALMDNVKNMLKN